MKKVIPIILLVSLLLVGCGNPYDKAVKNALKVIDQYENLDITASEASDKLDQLADTLNSYTDESSDHAYSKYKSYDYESLKATLDYYSFEFIYDASNINLEDARKDISSNKKLY